MKKIILIIVFLLSFLWSGTEGVVFAQQLPLYSQFMVNEYVQNPAVAGKNAYFEAMSDNRYQWIGITDAPRTYVLSVNGPSKSRKMGYGGYLFTDIVGPTRRIGISGSYAYHVQLTQSIKLSMALSAGLLQFAVDGSKITLTDPADLVISRGYQSVLIPDLGTGFYLYSDKWYAGIAAPQIFPAKLKFFNYSTSSSLSKIETHLYGSGGYRFDIGDNFKITPCFQVKWVKPTPVQADIGAKISYQNKIWIGGAYRTMDAGVLMAGYVFQENFSFSYSYDFITSNIKNYSSGTHELVLSIRFGHTPSPQSTAPMMK